MKRTFIFNNITDINFGVLLFSLLGHLFCVTVVFAEYPVAQFLLLNPSIRANGMGGAYTGLAEDTGGMVRNPTAGVRSKNSEIYFSSVRWGELDMDLVSFVGFISKSKPGNFAWGMYIQGFNSGEISGYNNTGQFTGKFKENNSAFGLNFSFKLTNLLAFGFTTKYVFMNITGEVTDVFKYSYALSGNAFATDLGISILSPNDRFGFGLSLNNLGSKMEETATLKSGLFSAKGTAKEPLPANFKMGIALKLLQNRNWILAFDFDRGMVGVKQQSGVLNFGTELSPTKWLAFRFGVSAGSNYLSGSAFGLGLKLGAVELDIANANKGELGETSNFALKIAFVRKPTEEKPSEEEVKPEPVREAPKPVKPEPVKEEIKPEPVKKEIEKLIPKKAEERINIAVAEFSGRNVSSMEAAIISDFLRGELVNTEQFNVIDRQNMETILNEAKFQNVSGCTTEECAVQMGKVLGVKKIVTGNLSKLLEKFYIVINLIDVETGKIESADKESATNADELSVACEKLAVRLASKFKQ